MSALPEVLGIMAEGQTNEVFEDATEGLNNDCKTESRGAKRPFVESSGSESDSCRDRDRLRAEIVEEMRKVLRDELIAEMRTEMREVMKESIKEVMKEVVREEMKSVLVAVKDLSDNVEKVEKKVGDLEQQTQHQIEEVNCVKKEMTDVKGEISEWEKIFSRMEWKVIDGEARSRRQNLVFYGVEERGGKEDCFKIVNGLIEGKCGIQGKIGIDRAHRIPTGVRPAGSKPRPLICHFVNFGDKQAVKKSKTCLPRGSALQMISPRRSGRPAGS